MAVLNVPVLSKSVWAENLRADFRVLEGIVYRSMLKGCAQRQSYPQRNSKYYKGVNLMTRTKIIKNNELALTSIEGFKKFLVQRYRC